MLKRLADWTFFSIPLCPGVRYIPGNPLLRELVGRGTADDTDQVPDASRISPPRMDRLHPDAAYLAVRGTLADPENCMQDISSPSHPVVVWDEDGTRTVGLADKGSVPDRDFAVRWSEDPAACQKPIGFITRNGADAFALVRLRAPASQPANEEHPQDIYFLLDRSGSMQGLKWRQTARAFLTFIRGLRRNDRIWATLFETRFQDLAEAPLFPEQASHDTGISSLEALGTGGGTEMLPALRHVLDMIEKHSAKRSVTLMIITDGQVGNEREILEHLRTHSQLRVHTFGIDAAVNDGFLETMAAQQRGTCCLLTPNDDIVGAVARATDRLRPPVYTDITATEGWELPEPKPIDLHAGEERCLCLRTANASNRVVLTGRVSGGGGRYTHEVELIPAQLPAVCLLWAMQRIKHLLANQERSVAIAMAKTHNLICNGTSFVAWDDYENVAVSAAERELYQPAMMVGFVASRERLYGGYGPNYICNLRTKPSSNVSEDGEPLGPPPKILHGVSPEMRYFSTSDDVRKALFDILRKRDSSSSDGRPDSRDARELLYWHLARVALRLHGPSKAHWLGGLLTEFFGGTVALFVLPPLTCEKGWNVIEALYEWAILKLRLARGREVALRMLASRLEQLSDQAERLQATRSWIEENLKDAPNLQRLALDQLSSVRASMPGTGRST